MLPKSIFRNSALAVLAVAMTATAIPSAAFAQAEQREERGRGWQRGGGDFRNQQAGQGPRAEWRRESQGEARPQRPPQAQVQPQRPAWGGSNPQAQQRPAWSGSNPQAQQRPAWGGSNPQAQQRPDRPSQPAWQGRAEGSQRDWGRQQGRDNQGRENRGRDWQSGTVNRPAPDRAGTPAVPQRGWDGTRWNGTNPEAGRNWNRDGRDRDGRDWNRDRNGREWNRDGRDWNRDRNGTYSDRNRHRDYRGHDSWRNDNWRRDNWRNHGANDYRRWNNDWRRDNRYNWSHYRSVNRGIYRLPRYYAPYRGYNYSRLSIGIFLNSGFYGQNYWINDPWSYRLPPAYGGYRWVRYYDDVLLVDTYSGEVVDVIYDFFW